jgi:Ala-tRNA(Pro) deacylase
MNVQDYLKKQGVQYDVVPHAHAFTAQEVAAAEHVTGHKFAKTVVLKAGGESYLFVLPASRYVDLAKAGGLVGKDLTMATEEEMKELFGDCEIGAEPPFGSQYGLPTYVDHSLGKADEIVFRAGRHDQTIKIKYADFERLEKPTVGSFAMEWR